MKKIFISTVLVFSVLTTLVGCELGASKENESNNVPTKEEITKEEAVEKEEPEEVFEEVTLLDNEV